jgi:dCTP deaminase
MVLSGPEIERRRDKGDIHITPWDRSRIGPNSYDLTLGNQLSWYLDAPLRMDRNNITGSVDLSLYPSGFLLKPGVLYLGHTRERTYCKGLVPFIEGRSSIGRLGLSIHVTAGLGDDGFDGEWTLEVTVVHPLILLPGVRICQIAFMELTGERKPYQGRYQGQIGPVASRFHELSICPTTV